MSYTFPTAVINFITYTARRWGQFPTITYDTSNGSVTAGNEIVVVASDLSNITVFIQSGASTNAQIKAAILASDTTVESLYARDLISVSIAGGHTADTNTAVSATPLTSAAATPPSTEPPIPSAAIPRYTVDPENPKAGDTIFNTTSDVLKYYNGTSWIVLSVDTIGATTSLNNLAAVAINTSLLPGSDNAIDLGSATKNARSLYFSTSLKNGVTTLATATEVSYLTGVTSAIQTQLNTKLSTVLAANVNSGAATNGQVLTADGASAATWQDAASGGATIALDNLDTTAINADLNPDTNNTYSLGVASTGEWAEINIFNVTHNSASNTDMNIGIGSGTGNLVLYTSGGLITSNAEINILGDKDIINGTGQFLGPQDNSVVAFAAEAVPDAGLGFNAGTGSPELRMSGNTGIAIGSAGAANDTSYEPAYFKSATTNSIVQHYRTTGVDNGGKIISPLEHFAHTWFVYGKDGGGKEFLDQVYAIGTIANKVIAVEKGSPDTRTYTSDGSNLTLTMGAGTYGVQSIGYHFE